MRSELPQEQQELLDMLEFAQEFAQEHNIQMFSGVVIGGDSEILSILVQDPHGAISTLRNTPRVKDFSAWLNQIPGNA